jgi:hypothetical protein
MPPVRPPRPFGRAAACPVRAAARARCWRVAEAQVSHGSLHRVQRVQPQGGQELLAADAVEQPGAQFVEVRAAVEQEYLAGDHRQQGVVRGPEPVAHVASTERMRPISLSTRSWPKTRQARVRRLSRPSWQKAVNPPSRKACAAR